MKKYISYIIILLLTATVALSAKIACDQDAFVQLDCTFAPLSKKRDHEDKSERKHKRHRHRPLNHHTPFPHIPVEEGTSLNWSGYVAVTNLQKPASGSVSNVTGTWVIPQLTPTSTNTYSSIWVGIDGYASKSVEQIGTEQDWINGTQQNYAWFEMYPAAGYEIVGFPVNVNDVIGADVAWLGNNKFELILTNYTHKVYTIIPAKYTKVKNVQRISAEWVVEAPTASNAVLPLANFGHANFINCQATIKGITGAINNLHWQNAPITMVSQAHVIKSLPSSLSQNGEAFSLTWEHQ